MATDPSFLVLSKVVDSLSKEIVQNAFFLAYQNAKEEEKEWLEFDMIDDVQKLKQIEILFDEDTKQELIDAVNDFLEVINIIRE